uniref:Uncharacterized protein n=1 Tax=Anopheles farauti TaxID=69004 RepID=A0A182QA90_9DIPT
MRSSVLFAVVLLVAGLCMAVQGSKRHHHRNGGSTSLSNSFMQLDEVKDLHPKHLQLLKQAVQSFEGTIDRSKLDAAGKEAAKRKALDQFMARLAEQKKHSKGHGH